MNIQYKTPTVELLPFVVEQPVCIGSTSVSGGDYGIYDDEFDDDSD